MRNLHFAGSDFLLEASDLDPDLLHALEDCGGAGPAIEAVDYIFDMFEVTGNVADCVGYLKGYGAWTDAELVNHVRNLERLVWLTGCALSEDESASFSNY